MLTGLTRYLARMAAWYAAGPRVTGTGVDEARVDEARVTGKTSVEVGTGSDVTGWI